MKLLLTGLPRISRHYKEWDDGFCVWPVAARIAYFKVAGSISLIICKGKQLRSGCSESLRTSIKRITLMSLFSGYFSIQSTKNIEIKEIKKTFSEISN